MAETTVSLPNLPAYFAEAFQIRSTNANPLLSEVEPASYAWLDSYGVHNSEERQKFRDSKYSLVAAMMFSTTDASRFRLVMDIALWYFTCQEMFMGGTFSNPEEMRGAIDAMLRVVNDPNAPSSKFPPAAMLQSCFQRLVKDIPPSVPRRFAAGLDEFLNAQLQDKFNRPTVPTPEKCLELKRDLAGVNMLSAVEQYALGLNLPDQVMDDQNLSRLLNTGTDVYNMIGDVYSWAAGMRGAYPLNILAASIHHNNKSDIQGGIDSVNRMIQERTNEFKDLKAKIPSFGSELDEQISRYEEYAEHCLHAYAEWAFMTPIYFGDQAENVRQTGVVKLEVPTSA